jgi:hypothetical protein
MDKSTRYAGSPHIMILRSVSAQAATMTGHSRKNGCPPASATRRRVAGSVIRTKRHSWAFRAEGAMRTALKIDSSLARSTGLSAKERTLRRLAMASNKFMITA